MAMWEGLNRKKIKRDRESIISLSTWLLSCTSDLLLPLCWDCYEFVTVTLVKWSTGYRIVSLSSPTAPKRKWNREVYFSQVLEEAPCTHWGATWGGWGRVQKDAWPGARAFTRACGWECLGVPKLGLIGQFKPKAWSFGQPTRSLT